MLTPLKFFPRLLLLGAPLVFGTVAMAADNPPEVSETVQSGIAPLAKLYEEKKWPEAIKMLDTLLTKTSPNTLDRAFLSGLKAQLVFTTGDTQGAIAPLETMLKIGDDLKLFQYPRLLPINETETLNSLTQLYTQEAGAAGLSMEKKRAYFDKAHGYAQRFVSIAKTSMDAQFLWARVLYSEAMINESQVDLAIMKQAAVEAEKVLYLTIKPKEDQYLLLLACLQQLGDYQRCADILELMVKRFPANKNSWPMLFQTYLTLQSQPGKDKDYELAPLVTLERAQAVGMMNTNKDNFALAGLYYNIQQFQFAADILSAGLKNGKIDPDQKNYELLAACYQQMGNDTKAIGVYLDAIKLFPKAASLEQQVGQLYYNSDKPGEAYKHLQAAVSKGLEKPGQTLLLISYLALEMKRLDDALDAAQKAVAADPKNKDAQSILGVIKDSIADREKFKKQK